jgi:hypothetical protein
LRRAPLAWLGPLAAAGTASALGGRALRSSGAEHSTQWIRSNYRGRPVSLGTGAGAVLGAGAGIAVLPVRLRAPAAVMVIGAAAAGAYDDLIAPGRERAGDKGITGHLAALRAGRPTGGVVKVALIGSAALVAGRLTGARGLGALSGAAVIAATSNAINLLDLRPGRAGKALIITASPLILGAGGAVAAVAVGAAAGAMPADLGERGMLGDLGANTLGSLLGLRLALLPPPARVVAAVLMIAVNAASERISFSAVIARTGWLDRFDQWGRAGARRGGA